MSKTVALAILGTTALLAATAKEMSSGRSREEICAYAECVDANDVDGRRVLYSGIGQPTVYLWERGFGGGYRLRKTIKNEQYTPQAVAQAELAPKEPEIVSGEVVLEGRQLSDGSYEFELPPEMGVDFDTLAEKPK